MNEVDNLGARVEPALVEPTLVEPAGDLPQSAAADQATLPLESRGTSPTDSAHSATLSLPCDFGDYELLAEIGRGGMGVVFRARQKSLRRTVALKMVLNHALASPEHLRRFRAEAQAAASLRHANIVRVLDSGEACGLPYLAMDYIDGPTLAEALRNRALDRETAVRHLASVARAVDYLHQHGVVHRDLKPSNILLDGDLLNGNAVPVVTDFGLAKLLDDAEGLTRSGIAAGTPSYMAPEQAAGHTAHVTPACDVYSLGAVLYEALTGRPPFEADTAVELLIQVLEREPPNPRQIDRTVPRELAAVCLRCLEKNPAKRYPSAAALADDLERFLKHEAVEARAARPWQWAARWSRREPALASRLAVMLPFYLVEVVNYHVLHRWGGDFHWSITAILATWAGLSLFFQRMMRSAKWQNRVPSAWAVVDAAALLAVLLKGDGLASPLMIGYPLLVVAAGLWFRVRLVWLMTGLALASYVLLSVDYYWWRPELWIQCQLNNDDHVYFIIGLLAMGAAVAYQVARVRALSRYYERG